MKTSPSTSTRASCQVYGTAKQGAKFGYTKVRGYHPLLATLAGSGEVLHARMRGGNAGAARGAGSFVRETISRIRQAGATGKLTFRADSALDSRKFITACQDHDVAFLRDGQDRNQGDPCRYRPDPRKRVGADPLLAFRAERTWPRRPFAAFKGTKDAVELRLIVRRVRPTPGSQLALDVVFDYHAILTDREGDTLAIESDHRAHAVVELAIRDLKAGGLAHVPSGIFTANAAWLALAVLAHNLARWTLAAAGDPWSNATTETFRAKLVAMPARIVHTARRLKLRAPTRWRWHKAFNAAMVRIAAIPAPT